MIMPEDSKTHMWGDKPYYSLNHYFQTVYGEKIYKIALDGGMTCPVRDGSLDTRGCIFCSQGGSGEFAVPVYGSGDETPDIASQLTEGKAFIRSKYNGGRYLAYFQPYTNTYAPSDRLRALYTAALEDTETAGISIGTRPDCLPDDVIALLSELKRSYPDKFIWIELGLQTIHRESIRYIRRGYDNSVFESAVMKLHDAGIPVIVHVILGLPGESKEQMLQTIEYINTFPVFGIKLQLLHVLAGTDLADDFSARKFDVLSKTEYIDILISCIEHLSPDIVIHRLTGDGPRDILIAPGWSTDKKAVLNGLLKEMKARGSYQGKNI
ncbi:hypothetical protein SAMN02910370_01173 [Lachnospiraceae bacterium XPB1003]|nr:hypothetical protein SAMN02910370_01173 [Lachnospiraceae bacterium XPB1003]